MTYRVVVPGEAHGTLVRLEDPLSLWGGLDPETGRVIDVSHPQHGLSLAGLVVWMPRGRGSSSSSTVLAETMRRHTAPAGLILNVAEPILVIGSLVGQHMYDVSCPIAVGPEPDASVVTISIDHDHVTEHVDTTGSV